MRPKTEELLYYLLWACDTLTSPLFRNMTGSFEVGPIGWTHRQLAELDPATLGGRDPELLAAAWAAPGSTVTLGPAARR